MYIFDVLYVFGQCDNIYNYTCIYRFTYTNRPSVVRVGYSFREKLVAKIIGLLLIAEQIIHLALSIALFQSTVLVPLNMLGTELQSVWVVREIVADRNQNIGGKICVINR